MTAKDRKVFAIALVLMALVSIFVPVASATSETWYLCTDTPDPSLSKSAPGDGTVALTDGVMSDWSTETPAQCSLTIGAGTWTVDLDYTAPTGGGDVDIMIYRTGGPSGNLKIGEQNNVGLSGGTHTKTVAITGSDVDFVSGDYIVLWITWDHQGGTDSLTVNCGSLDSTLKTPDSDPGFPVPELSSLVLFSVGLLALVGYVVYRRKNI